MVSAAVLKRVSNLHWIKGPHVPPGVPHGPMGRHLFTCVFPYWKSDTERLKLPPPTYGLRHIYQQVLVLTSGSLLEGPSTSMTAT